jgi:hypothetical protein
MKCERCGKLRYDLIEAMPMTSLRYRLLDGPAGSLCYGHKVETVDDVRREAALDAAGRRPL